jgi:hypothetical protein
MEISSLQVGLDALFVLIGSLSGAMTVWYTLKGKVEIQRVILDNLVVDMEELKQDRKEGQAALHRRVDDLKGQVEDNRSRNEASISSLKEEMGKMEIRIINAIHESK